MSKYPAIPDFSDLESMKTTVRALKDAVEQLGGLRQGDNLGAPAVYLQERAPFATRGTVLQSGDLWINPASATTSYWDGNSWVTLAPGGFPFATAASVATLSGRNRIINGQGRVNQRGYVSGTATGGANQYTLDRWRVVTSGQNLTFTGSSAGRTMTAPAGGVEQVIAGENIYSASDTYAINWSGSATCTINGTPVLKGDTVVVADGSDVTVRFTSGTFTDVQFESDTVTPYERVPFNEELARCQRYYCNTIFNVRFNAAAGSQVFENAIYWPVTMRAAPVATLDTAAAVNCTASVLNTGTFGARATITSTAAGDARLLIAAVTASAEL